MFRVYQLSLFIFSLLVLVLSSSSEPLKFQAKSPDLSEVRFDDGFHTGFFNPSEAIKKLLEKSENSGNFGSFGENREAKSTTDYDENFFPIANSPLGGLRGSLFKSRQDKFFYAFRGIPYAKPAARFERAELVEAWENLRDARTSGPMCLQPGGPNGVHGQEDCLTLDVYHPLPGRCQEEESESGKLPVIVHIHGGGFTEGFGTLYTPEFFMDHCVVYCNINYRLGVLGFLATEDGVIPGNAGLKDQALALKWIHEYIEYFRGDKKSVTAMGISAGGASVSYLLLSPETQGLIHRGIAMSGNALCPWAVAEKPGDAASFIAALLNCPTASTVDMKNCLKAIDAVYLTLAQTYLPGFLELGPVIEKEGDSAFLTKNPYTLYKTGEFHHCPLLIGFVEDEAMAWDRKWEELNTEWNKYAPQWLLYDKLGMDEDEMNEISGKIRVHYFGDEPISSSNRKRLVELYSDRLFIQPAMEMAELHSKFAPVYSYVTSYKSGQSASTAYGYEIPKICHGDDYVFFWPYLNYECCTEPYDFSTRIVRNWVNFAKDGNPGEKLWTPIEGEASAKWFELSSPNKIHYNYKEKGLRFWKSLGLSDKEYAAK